MGRHHKEVKGHQQPLHIVPLAQEEHLVLHAQRDRLGLKGQQVRTIAHQHQARPGFPLMEPREGLQQEGLILLIRQAAHMAHHQAVRQPIMGADLHPHLRVKAIRRCVDGMGDDGEGQVHRRTGPLGGFLRAGPKHIGIPGQRPPLDAVQRTAGLAGKGGIAVLRIVAVSNAHRDAILRRQLQGREVIEHALVVPDDVIILGMGLKEGADLAVILHRILAAAGDHIGLAQSLAPPGIGRILIAGEEIELHPAGINPAAISHQEILHAAGRSRHAHRQHADGRLLLIHTYTSKGTDKIPNIS